MSYSIAALLLANVAGPAASETPAAPTVHARVIATPVVRRLTRVEYGNSVRDLLGIDYPFDADLPEDAQVAGFDNIGDALSFSPVLLEGYLKSARRSAELAVGKGSAAPVMSFFPATDIQSEWQEGMPVGTRGGVRAKHFFPRDGDYELRAFTKDLRELPLPPTEGVRFFHMRVPVSAGLHEFIVTFPDESAEHEGSVPNLDGPGGAGRGGPVDINGSSVLPTIEFWLDGKKLKSFDVHAGNAGETSTWTWPGPPSLDRAEITGPFNAGAAARTALQDQLGDCKQKDRSEELACVTKVFGGLARRAYRRDVTSKDIEPVLAAYSRSRARPTKDLEDAVAMGLRSILMSPNFLFRIEHDPVNAKAGQAYPISDYELATRLSYFLWSTIPDERLLDLARRGQLHEAPALRREVLRMLVDSRADALVDNFGMQWLGLGEIDAMKPDPKVYPEFDEFLRHAFKMETRLFLRSIIRENRSVQDIISGKYTYLNDRLAKLYGIPDVKGSAFRKVNLADAVQRGGVLGQGSVLMVTSHAARTSPILRGKWLLTNLMNSPPPVPPPGVPPLDVTPVSGRALTAREQAERHRTSPVCAHCHLRMDPYGFAMENYDVIGRWRDKDEGNIIDASGKVREETFEGPSGLKKMLLTHSDDFAAATVSRLMTYALGRQLENIDQPVVKKIVEQTRKNQFRFADLVMGIVSSDPFLMREAKPALQQQARQESQEVSP